MTPSRKNTTADFVCALFTLDKLLYIYETLHQKIPQMDYNTHVAILFGIFSPLSHS